MLLEGVTLEFMGKLCVLNLSVVQLARAAVPKFQEVFPCQLLSQASLHGTIWKRELLHKLGSERHQGVAVPFKDQRQLKLLSSSKKICERFSAAAYHTVLLPMTINMAEYRSLLPNHAFFVC